ncbi:hypothetical protein A3B52_02605 [Candidatus Curtissbacteria bacterium RIFCSPLOWO2_01_FULL_41_28]|uniref:Uncharacterized protein n=1 Tax=Candidatus Curtissbacteria bacterium RIFOXYA1_FULL_41_14 TaxID=1797737 RepID=A0A1F5HCR0_9BACT|nr:MAG: hypothetical protein A3B52_02605 [Candidatus Curtissbacteria bacterium RIFCSPLOWO2_01_FULL_41_28]OGE01856.1 MAG: hypothetical protein A2196_03030 [Candidatus Curtissbacteria bacterium RIFOXYA1_FULL_41_14]OGE15952.1 MAG: hypothetical protein A2409_04340 [Candidatus Curtissbacteria bacterium RIFOXYC1_FULL_41_36]
MTTLFLLLPLALNLFQDSDFKTDIKIPRTSTNMEIAADAGFTNQTLQFSAGQTIYVRVTANNSGDTKSVLNLRDNLYNLLATYGFSKTGSNPYQFTVNFPAPGASGNYSLEANIESNGSVVNYVRTIEVEGSNSDQSANSQVNVKVENKVNTGNQTSPTPGVEGVYTPGVSPDNVLGEQASQSQETQGFFASLWAKIASFFSGLF